MGDSLSHKICHRYKTEMDGTDIENCKKNKNKRMLAWLVKFLQGVAFELDLSKTESEWVRFESEWISVC